MGGGLRLQVWGWVVVWGCKRLKGCWFWDILGFAIAPYRYRAAQDEVLEAEQCHTDREGFVPFMRFSARYSGADMEKCCCMETCGIICSARLEDKSYRAFRCRNPDKTTPRKTSQHAEDTKTLEIVMRTCDNLPQNTQQVHIKHPRYNEIMWDSEWMDRKDSLFVSQK